MISTQLMIMILLRPTTWPDGPGPDKGPVINSLEWCGAPNSIYRVFHKEQINVAEPQLSN